MKTLENFKKLNEPKRRISRLKKFEKEIIELYESNYQVEQIQIFLRNQGVKITVDGINKFKRNLSIKNSSLKTPKISKNSEEVKNSENSEHKATQDFFSNLDRYQN